jgi:type I restriction enzyme S subunit
VDFDPVRAKAEGRDTGLPPEVAALFPDSFEEVDGREVPRGWGIGTVQDLCFSVENGGTPKRMESAYWDAGTIPWFKTGELSDDPLIDSDEKITELGLTESACRVWQPKTILIALYASPTVGRLGILEIPGTANQACSALAAKRDFGFLFLYYSLLFSRDQLQNIAVGAAQQNINQQVLKEHQVLLPDSAIAHHFQQLIEPLYEKKLANLQQSRTLAKIRDALLPKLMSGDMDVSHSGSGAF